MSRVVVTGRHLAFGLGLLLSACNTPQPAVSVPAANVHTQALAEGLPPTAAAVDEHASCGQSGESCGCAAHEGDAPGASCGTEAHTAQAEPAADRGDSAQLTRITDPSQVCMVRNHFMGRPQLSVSAGNGTYYGCCAGCANRLLADPNARVAIDPVSHHPVDKALAVLARTARGSVLYFENEQNLSAFRAGLN